MQRKPGSGRLRRRLFPERKRAGPCAVTIRRQRDVEDASSSSSASSAGASRAIREASPEPLQEVADWELEERIAIMFVVGAPAPVASERGALLPKATKQVVQRGADLIRALCKAHGSQLSQSFGNFDQLVGLGWLLGDVVLGCFVSRADALAIGRRAGKLAPDFKKEFVAPRTRAGKKKFSSEEEQARAFSAAEEEAAAIRLETVELPFPAVRAARAQVAALKRKRVEADERPPAPAPPPAPVRTHDSMGTEWHSIHISMLGEYIPIYKSSVRDASSMVAEAECELEEARKAEERLESALIAAQLACDRQEKRPEPHRSPLMLDAEWEEWEAARDAWMERLRAHQAAQREADWARDDARYALHDAKSEVRYALRSLESAKAKECCNLEELHDFVDHCLSRLPSDRVKAILGDAEA